MMNNGIQHTYEVQVQCPSCGKMETFKMHTLIDTLKDPKAEMKIFDGDFFSHVCSRCGTVMPISYSCMYHDGSRKLLVGFADSEKDLESMRLTLNGTHQRDKLDEVLRDWLSICTVRLVRSEYALQEKVLLAHFDLDDRIIEIARAIVKKELAKTRDNVKELYFNTEKDGGYAFLIATEEGIEDSFRFTEEMYQDLKKQFADAVEANPSIEIDAAWAEKVIG